MKNVRRVSRESSQEFVWGSNMYNKNKGIVCIVGAAFCFALMNLFVRLAGNLPSVEKSFFRNVVAVFVAFILLVRKGDKIEIRKDSIGLLFVRAGFGTMGILCNFYAIDHLNISDATMLNKLSPFFAIIFSAIFLREMANKVQILSVIMAFVGSLFIIKPQFNMSVMPALIGTLGGLGAGIAYTAVRRLGQKGVKGTVIVLFFSVFSCLVTLPGLIIAFKPMSSMQFLSLIMAGVSATGGQFFITAAYTFAPAKEISVFDYSQVIFAALLGFVFLDQIPDILSIMGYCIICLVAVLMWQYNKKVDKKSETSV